MRKVALLLSLALLMGALAGCTDSSGDEDDGTDAGDDDAMTGDDTNDSGDDSQDDSTDDDTGGEDDGTNETDDNDDGSADENLAPTVDFSSDISSGEPGVTVTFTIDATDPEEDAMTWTFDGNGDNESDEDGDALPANITFTYDDAGVFNASVSVSDGTSQTNATIVITVEVDAAEVPGPVVFSGQVLGVGCVSADPDDGGGSRFHTIETQYYEEEWIWDQRETPGLVEFYSDGSLVEGMKNSEGVVPESDSMRWCVGSIDSAAGPLYVATPAPKTYTVTLAHPLYEAS